MQDGPYLNFDDYDTVCELRAAVEAITGVPSSRQTLILAGRRLPIDDVDRSLDAIKQSIRPGQMMMCIGSALPIPVERCESGHQGTDGD